LALALFSVVPKPSSAASPGRLSCADDAECTRLATAAHEQSKAGRYDAAQRYYEKAYQRRADPQLLFNLARVLHKAGRQAIAVIYYQKFLDARELDAEERRKAEQYLKQAQEEGSAGTPPASPPEPATAVPSPAPPPQAAATAPDAVVVTPVGSSEPHRETPLYRKWWLWTAVGAGVGVIVIGLAAGLAPRRPDLTGIPEAQPFGP
jgi:tetratricopeptide (TPR) repeat protein